MNVRIELKVPFVLLVSLLLALPLTEHRVPELLLHLQLLLVLHLLVEVELADVHELVDAVSLVSYGLVLDLFQVSLEGLLIGFALCQVGLLRRLILEYAVLVDLHPLLDHERFNARLGLTQLLIHRQLVQLFNRVFVQLQKRALGDLAEHKVVLVLLRYDGLAVASRLSRVNLRSRLPDVVHVDRR